MSTAIFLRLLRDEDKAQALAEAIAALREGRRLESMVYPVRPVSFRQVPGSPFAYWVSERIRRLFTELPAFEGDGRTVRQGLATADDFRFVRAWWEVPSECILDGANGPDWREDFRHSRPGAVNAPLRASAGCRLPKAVTILPITPICIWWCSGSRMGEQLKSSS